MVFMIVQKAVLTDKSLTLSAVEDGRLLMMFFICTGTSFFFFFFCTPTLFLFTEALSKMRNNQIKVNYNCVTLFVVTAVKFKQLIAVNRLSVSLA